MGCGMSRFDPMEEGTGCGGLRTPLRRRLDEVRKLDGAAPDIGTSSAKVLLKDDGDFSVSHHSFRKSVSVPSSILVNEPPPLQKINTREKEGTVEITDHVKEESGMISINNDYNSKNNTDHGGWGKAKDENYVSVHNHNHDQDHNDSDEQEDDDDNERRISKNDDTLWFGSPSFREYCVNYSDSEDSLKHDVVDPVKSHVQNTEAVLATQSSGKLVCTYESCEWDGSRHREHPEKKETRGGRFRKVFPMHKPSFWHGRSMPQKLAGKVA